MEASTAAARAGRPVRIATIGGGGGQVALIRAARLLGWHVDAVVAMADDGFSTGFLRERAGALPPGDIRSCLVALAADPDAPEARAFAHRFPYLDDHALGNLVLTALAEEGLAFPDAIGVCERLLGCVGSVHPSTCEQVRLVGRTAAGEVVRGQAELSRGVGRIDEVWLEPAAPAADEGAVAAIRAADAVVIGPGSLFTSLIPNLLVPGVLEAVRAARGPRVVVLPKAYGAAESETRGMDAASALGALERHGLAGLVDVAVVHRAAPGAADAGSVSDAALRAVGARVGRVVADDFTDPDSPVRHAAAPLAAALERAIGG